MANYLFTHYYLVDNSKNTINTNSSTSDFNNFMGRYDVNSSYLDVNSRRGWSANKISELLQASNKIGKLSFLAQIRNSDNPYILIPLDSFPKIILEIQNLISWCKVNTDKLLNIFWDYYDNQKEIIKDIDNTEFPPDEFCLGEDGDHPYFLFSYLRMIINMIKHAERTEQSIVCITFM